MSSERSSLMRNTKWKHDWALPFVVSSSSSNNVMCNRWEHIPHLPARSAAGPFCGAHVRPPCPGNNNNQVHCVRLAGKLVIPRECACVCVCRSGHQRSITLWHFWPTTQSKSAGMSPFFSHRFLIFAICHTPFFSYSKTCHSFLITQRMWWNINLIWQFIF